MPAHYFLGTRLVAVSSQPPLWDNLRVAEVSQLFLCPTCGEVWARIAIPDARWVAQHIGCRQHPSMGYDVGGSFIPAWRQNLRDLPIEVLQYELALRLANYPQE